MGVFGYICYVDDGAIEGNILKHFPSSTVNLLLKFGASFWEARASVAAPCSLAPRGRASLYTGHYVQLPADHIPVPLQVRVAQGPA